MFRCRGHLFYIFSKRNRKKFFFIPGRSFFQGMIRVDLQAFGRIQANQGFPALSPIRDDYNIFFRTNENELPENPFCKITPIFHNPPQVCIRITL